jgi:hypothetical protein
VKDKKDTKLQSLQHLKNNNHNASYGLELIFLKEILEFGAW